MKNGYGQKSLFPLPLLPTNLDPHNSVQGPGSGLGCGAGRLRSFHFALQVFISLRYVCIHQPGLWGNIHASRPGPRLLSYQVRFETGHICHRVVVLSATGRRQVPQGTCQLEIRTCLPPGGSCCLPQGGHRCHRAPAV